MTLPKLPSHAFSLLGPIAVTVLDPERGAKEDLYGRFLPADRRIEIAADMAPAIEWVTYWHEVTHAILVDSGVENVLKPKQIEAICDAVGTYCTAMMRDGQLIVRAK